LSYRGIFKEIFILSRERNRLSRFYREATGAFCGQIYSLSESTFKRIRWEPWRMRISP